MRGLSKSARYALCAAVELARAGPGRPVSAARVAAQYAIPATVMAKVFQQLVRRGLATGTRGAGGGYRLARPAARITILDVVDAIDRPRPAGGGALPRGARTGDEAADRRLRRILDEVDELVRCTFASISVETLVRQRPGLRERAG